MEKKKIVILTGAGMSAESGINTFRDINGLWENHKIDEVANPKGWLKDPQLVLNFYNQRRRQLTSVEPNAGHKELLRLNEKYDVRIVTQNIDDLHERAGSTNVVHVHGLLTQARSSGNEDNVKDIGYEDINLGDLCEEGFQMRPHIVWFTEQVPLIGVAEDLCREADIIIIIGTSMQVNPAAGLYRNSKTNTQIFYIDKNPALFGTIAREPYILTIAEAATTGVKKIVDVLLDDNYKLPREIEDEETTTEIAPESTKETAPDGSESTS